MEFIPYLTTLHGALIHSATYCFEGQVKDLRGENENDNGHNIFSTSPEKAYWRWKFRTPFPIISYDDVFSEIISYSKLLSIEDIPIDVGGHLNGLGVNVQTCYHVPVIYSLKKGRMLRQRIDKSFGALVHLDPADGIELPVFFHILKLYLFTCPDHSKIFIGFGSQLAPFVEGESRRFTGTNNRYITIRGHQHMEIVTKYIATNRTPIQYCIRDPF